MNGSQNILSQQSPGSTVSTSNGSLPVDTVTVNSRHKSPISRLLGCWMCLSGHRKSVKNASSTINVNKALPGNAKPGIEGPAHTEIKARDFNKTAGLIISQDKKSIFITEYKMHADILPFKIGNKEFSYIDKSTGCKTDSKFDASSVSAITGENSNPEIVQRLSEIITTGFYPLVTFKNQEGETLSDADCHDFAHYLAFGPDLNNTLKIPDFSAISKSDKYPYESMDNARIIGFDEKEVKFGDIVQCWAKVKHPFMLFPFYVLIHSQIYIGDGVYISKLSPTENIYFHHLDMVEKSPDNSFVYDYAYKIVRNKSDFD